MIILCIKFLLTCISVIAWHWVNISGDSSVNFDAQATSLNGYIGCTIVAIASSHSMLTKGSSVRAGDNGVIWKDVIRKCI